MSNREEEHNTMSNQMTISFTGGKKVTASYNGFQINTDQSVDNGGEASAPEPYDLLLAALGTCAGFYVLSFCQQRSIASDDIRLVQRWERSEDGKRIATIRLAVQVPAGFPEKYHTALVRAAGQCAVKKTFENPPDIVVQTVVAPAG